MRKATIPFWLALACSLGLHVVGLEAYFGYVLLHSRRSARPGPAGEILVVLDDSFDSPEEMGDARGTGIGSNSSPGERPQRAREADEDQALLSRDPVGVGRIGAPPSKWTGQPGDAGSGGTPTLTAPSSDAPPLSVGSAISIAVPLQPPPIPRAIATSDPGPIPQVQVPVLPAPLTPPAAAPKPPAQASEAAPQPTAKSSQQSQPGDARRPGQPIAPADPLPPSESDSDPFARIGTVVYQNGRLDVRLGRKVKTTRPQIGVAGAFDVLSLNFPKIVLEVHISPTGNVTDVQFAHKSGSIAIDEPTKTAVFDWWFEPAKDRSGKPIPDVVYFTIEFR